MLSYFLAPYVSLMLASGYSVCSPEIGTEVKQPSSKYVSAVIYLPAGQAHNAPILEAVDASTPESTTSAQVFTIVR